MSMTKAARDAILAALTAEDGPWDPAAVFVGVFSDITPHGLNTVRADLTVPAGAGFAADAVTTWSSPHVKTDGRAMVDSPVQEFRPANAGEGTTLRGWFVADAAVAGNLLFWGTFRDLIPLSDETRALRLVLRLAVDPEGGQWADVVVMNG
jgi:hypothetical protein